MVASQATKNPATKREYLRIKQDGTYASDLQKEEAGALAASIVEQDARAEDVGLNSKLDGAPFTPYQEAGKYDEQHTKYINVIAAIFFLHISLIFLPKHLTSQEQQNVKTLKSVSARYFYPVAWTMVTARLSKYRGIKYKNPPTRVKRKVLLGSQYEKRATFQAAMKLTIIIGQCFGLNPVLGVCNIDTSKLSSLRPESLQYVEIAGGIHAAVIYFNASIYRAYVPTTLKREIGLLYQHLTYNLPSFPKFTYFSGRCVYSMISILGQGALFLFCILKFIKDSDATLASNTFLVFYGLNFITVVLFFRIAAKWPPLCQIISITEAADPCTDLGLIRKCNLSCLLVLVLAIIEHVLADLSGAATALDCHRESIYESFIKNSYPWIFVFLPYDHVIGFSTQILNLQCTFNWNYADLFVICLCFYLTSRLEQVNRKVNAVKGKIVPPSYWRAMREEYNRATNLVRRVDDVISGIIFISFANNLFFICLQLLHTLADGVKAVPSCRVGDIDVRPLKGYEQAMYVVYSFIFLVMRSLAVSLVAARVHTSSKETAFALYDVPSTIYCIEIQRFLEQIHGDTVALSGLQFFNIKRGLVLAIAGTIVTYELVLLQFTGVTPTSAPPTILSRTV